MTGQLQMEFNGLGRHRSTSLTKKMLAGLLLPRAEMLMGLASKPIPTSFC